MCVCVFVANVHVHGRGQIMLCGRFPFWGKTDIEFLASVTKGPQMRGEAWTGVSEECKGFVKCLLEIEPKERPTATDALAHSWMQSSGGDLRTLTSQAALAESFKKTQDDGNDA